MMWWRIGNFVAVFVMTYMILTLGVRISDDVNTTAGVCFTSVATAITIIGSHWFDLFCRRRVAAKERLLYLRELWQKVDAEAEAEERKLFFHHEPHFTDTLNQYFYVNNPSAHGIIAKDGHIREP